MDNNHFDTELNPKTRSYNIFQDWKINNGNAKSRLVMLLFRLASLVRSRKVLSVLFFWYLLFYRISVEWLLNIELHWNATIGRGFRLEHGHGTVIHGDAVIGEFCTIRHLTTLGIIKRSDGSYTKPPQLGNNVDVGASVVIIGDVEIGDNVLIGAGSVVVRSVPKNCVVLGNPAKVIKKIYDYDFNS
jgi:putative colanic acid biosynthesis acetyltransferase WcaB